MCSQMRLDESTERTITPHTFSIPLHYPEQAIHMPFVYGKTAFQSRIGIYTQLHIRCDFFVHSACGIKILPYHCNVVQRQCSLKICDSNHHYSAPLTAVLVGIKHSNQCQQQRINVGMGRIAEHEHLEIRMHTANRWSYGNYLEQPILSNVNLEAESQQKPNLPTVDVEVGCEDFGQMLKG